MASAAQNAEARHYFLNEQHELRGEKGGGGRIPEYLGVNWHTKGEKIYSSLVTIGDHLKSSRDPLKNSRYFLLAVPEQTLVRRSKDKRYAEQGKIEEPVSYGDEEARIFARLGLDLIHVNRDGSAMVHARADNFEQLKHTSQKLDAFGPREKARWATINSFSENRPEFVYDVEWTKTLVRGELVNAVFELQPLLTGIEVDAVVRALSENLKRGSGEGFRNFGNDFSGRRWLSGRFFPESFRRLATSYYSIQSIHPPLYSIFLTTPSHGGRSAKAPFSGLSTSNLSALPCVAVVDTGIPTDHRLLAPYRRGTYSSPTASGGASGNHGSMVTSRVVFGDLDCASGTPSSPIGECSFYDVNVALDDIQLDEKAILPALEAIVAVAPDVRVFNLSFDNARPLDDELEISRREKLNLVQDLDNFIFARDVLVVIAAGNSRPGIVPTKPYPRHFDERPWALGTWPRAFNALTCGAFTLWPSSDGVASEVGAPSPFTKAGWGTAESPKPDLAEHGGNGNARYHFQPGLGVWGTSAASNWEDGSGTSFSAPLLARKAAHVFRHLESYCEPGTRPFAATVKAYLTLSAEQSELSGPLRPLAERTLGRGNASIEWLRKPRPDRAMIVWQGTLEGPKDLIRVQIPIPKAWLAKATSPRLRIVLSWDSPVNAAVEQMWASRKVTATLRPRPEAHALSATGANHKTYPLSERKYDLKKLPKGAEVPDDELWLLELSYQPAAEYHPSFTFNPQQRVAFAAELIDESEKPVTPQAALQALPSIASMTRFSVGTSVVRNPVVLKNRI